MEKLRSLNRLVDISEPILAEDSTFNTIALSLSAVLEQLSENATHHDYLVVLLLVLLAESGFHIIVASDTSKWEQNARLVRIPANWKSRETGVYEIHFTLRDVNNVTSKLIGITHGDKLVINILSHVEEMKVYSMVIQTLKYVNPYTKNLCFRYMNLKEISRRFKDELIMPLRAEILLLSNLMGPSLQSLPIELRIKIASMLPQQELRHLSICSKILHETCRSII
ncbi:F-box only protein 7 [Monomorium pharaonis]|uniref:F-box only protein 7 n=1 Tax=Monomorium pharaonis TaxID=307658 RepID=UPI00063F2EA4|nr:F-box only protein 7 [Monomorium pharaonis]